ncbi:MAG TPA: DEAD/DEAH box helicase [Opitutales bacterium]|nr:DEAD/DEAH box helicase [Opitutales bacterium]
MEIFLGPELPGASQPLLPHLWSTFFLVVPLVSTTFASFQRMFGAMPANSLGWLFIDEAGQAVPQAAVGAISKTKRAVVVGDPMQLEPIVSLHGVITQAICEHYNISPSAYTAPNTSVQHLADRASSYIGELHKPHKRSVGVPLLVHRRCERPMFCISNAVAYGGQMVWSRGKKESKIRGVLGDSQWIHTVGNTDGHWCEQEGECVIDLLSQLVERRVNLDLYIMTPFSKVAENLRRLIIHSGVLKGCMAESSARGRWVNTHVGTVHTAQGAEAEAVILVLGAPGDSQGGARGWAGEKPNLLNVAVSRAKEVLYVVGNRDLWKHAGHFDLLARRLDQPVSVAANN